MVFRCVHVGIYSAAFANRRSWEHWHSFALSPQECRIAHPIVKCTYCRSEFQQERWDILTPPPTDEFQCLFMLIKWTSLNVLLCLLFTVKPIQSARNVPRMSNSLEPWVTPLLPDKPFTFILWFKLHTSHVSVALSSRLKMPTLRCVGIGFLSNSYWKLIEGLQISGISNCC